MKQNMETKFRAHILDGYKSVIWECHVKPDWLLLWQQINDELILILLDTGSHSDLF